MALLRALLALFLLPGNSVIKAIGINTEEDGGIIRSFVNMMFWGILAFLLALLFIRGHA
ncbi:MAG: hypothetical protein V3U57_01995 [Robiginitomaculum sp.]